MTVLGGGATTKYWDWKYSLKFFKKFVVLIFYYFFTGFFSFKNTLTYYDYFYLECTTDNHCPGGVCNLETCVGKLPTLFSKTHYV
jgi:hypothetical protein